MLHLNRVAECHAPSSALWEIHSTKHSPLGTVRTEQVSPDMMVLPLVICPAAPGMTICCICNITVLQTGMTAVRKGMSGMAGVMFLS